MKLFVIMSRADSAKAAETIYVEELTVNADGTLSALIGNSIRNFAPNEWDGVSVIKYANVTGLALQ